MMTDSPVRRLFFFFQAEDGIRDLTVTGVQTCALPISAADILEVRTETGVNLCAPNGALRRALRLGTRINTHFAYLFRLRTSDDPVRVAYSVSPIRLKGKTPDAAGSILPHVPPQL